MAELRTTPKQDFRDEVLVGGASDGRVVSVESGRRKIAMPRPASGVSFSNFAAVADAQREVYRRESINFAEWRR